MKLFYCSVLVDSIIILYNKTSKKKGIKQMIQLIVIKDVKIDEFNTIPD